MKFTFDDLELEKNNLHWSRGLIVLLNFANSFYSDEPNEGIVKMYRECN